MKKTMLFLVALLATLSLIAASCGDDDEAEVTDPGDDGSEMAEEEDDSDMAEEEDDSDMAEEDDGSDMAEDACEPPDGIRVAIVAPALRTTWPSRKASSTESIV